MIRIVKLCAKRKFKSLFLDKTDDVALQFFRYLFVGGAATVADWGTLWLLKEQLLLNVYASAAISFCFGLSVNFSLSKLFVFSGTPSNRSKGFQIGVYLITGLIGLGFTEGIMYLLDEKAGLYYMISKVIATAVVFVWNFGSKKIILYRKRDKN